VDPSEGGSAEASSSTVDQTSTSPTPAAGDADHSFQAARQAAYTLRNMGNGKRSKRPVTQRDLVRVGNLLLEAFARHGEPGTGISTSDSRKYLQALAEKLDLPEEDMAAEPVTRGDVVLFFYRLTSVLFDVSPVDGASYRYSDIPRYHFMNLPVETLDGIGIRLGRSEKEFGTEDQVNLGWLSEASLKLVELGERTQPTKEMSSLEL